MTSWFALIVLAFAVSFDGFGVGTTYGMRKIRMPLISVMIIAACSGLFIFLAIQLGHLFSNMLSPTTAENIGALILIAIGAWAMIQTLLQKSTAQQVPSKKKTLVHFEIKKLGLVIEILKRPVRADVDNSGNISSWEAVLLGTALSLDAFGAGIGAALIGLPVLLTTVTVAVSCGFFLYSGLTIGNLFSDKAWMAKLSVMPPLVLIFLGIVKLF